MFVRLERFRRAFAWASVGLGCLLSAGVRADVFYNVTINTSAIFGVNGMLAFDFLNGDSQFSNNRVTARTFSTDGILANRTDVVLTDVVFFNETLRPITFGNVLSFSLQLTQNFAGPGAPDGFSFFFLNSAGTLPLFPTSDPTGADSLFVVDIDGSLAGRMMAFRSVTGTTVVLDHITSPVNPIAAVPEPSTYGALGAVLLGGLVLCRRGSSRVRRD